MRIGIDARLYDESGVGRYIRNLILELSRLDYKNEYFIFVLEKRKNLQLPENFKVIAVDIRWYTLKEQIALPRFLAKFNLDLIHFPHFNVPIFYQGKFIVTIHDLIHQHFSMKKATTLNPFFYQIKKYGYRKVFQNAINKSFRIITPSEFVKTQLINEWHVPSKKIVVTHEGVDEQILQLAKKDLKKVFEEVSNKYGIKGQYIYYVGNAHPHKNVEGLIKAFLILNKKYPNLQLVLSGPDHYFWSRIKNKIKNENVLYTGFVTDQELVALYKYAACYIVPSFEEGFGIPILEAFATQTPVIASNAASLPEVGRNACLYFNPDDEHDLMSKVILLLENEKIKTELVKKGIKRLEKFSWKDLTKKTISVYNLI